MPRVLSVLSPVLFLWALGTGSAAAEDPLFEPFAPDGLLHAEIRLLQAALTLQGDYDGPLDGEWGRGARAGLEDYVWREFSHRPLNLHAAALAVTFVGTVEDEGWRHAALPGTGLRIAQPEAILTPPEPEDGGTRRWSRAGSLTLLAHRFDADGAASWHAAALTANESGPPPSESRTPDTMTTEGRLGDGRRFFTHSARIGEHWDTLFLAAGPDEATRYNLIRASVATGDPVPWAPAPGGRLEGLVRATLTLVDTLEPEEAPSPLPAALPGSEEGAASGTGFYVGARELVTAAHVIEGCARVALADGTALDLLASDAELDIAVLRSPRPSPAWLRLAPRPGARLGQQVHAMGYPYYGIAGTSLHLTGGNVSALTGVDDDDRFFSFTAPVQPGNSGGPLLARDGAVLGLVVSRLSESFIEAATGTLPQNVNYALAPDQVAAFLARAGIAPRADGLGGFDVGDGVPYEAEAAVRPVICD